MGRNRDGRAVLYTIGYQGKSVAALIRTLQEHGIRRLVDVRMSPHSRQKGFSLMMLFERLRKAGIAYEHLGELGNPPEIRQLFHEGDIDEGRRLFRGIITNGKGAYVDLLVGLARIQPTVIMCREEEPADCHRLVVAEVAQERSDQPLHLEHL